MGQMMFTKYLVVVNNDVDMHNTSEVLFRLCANTDPQRDSILTKSPAGVLDHAAIESAVVKIINTKIKSLAAGKMGYGTRGVGDLIAAAV